MPANYDIAQKLLQNAKRVVLFPRAAEDTDSVVAALALAEALESRGVTPTVILDEPSRTPLSFLAGHRFVSTTLAVARELTIDIPRAATETQSVSYERTPSSLRIHVLPEHGEIRPSDVSLRSTGGSLGDVLVVIGARRLQDLGPRFTEQAEPFYRTPIIALDCHPDTEEFATVHLSDNGARSCSALAYELIQKVAGALTPSIATTLLTGVLSQSQSFQRSMTSPQEFELAATLLEKGADRHAVVQHLYKTKPLPMLKLWGRVLSRLTSDPLERAWFAHVTTADFTETNSTPDALVEVMHDVLAQTSQAKLITLTYAVPTQTANTDTQNQTGILVGSPSQPMLQRYVQELGKRLTIVRQTQNEHLAHLRAQAAAQDVELAVKTLGEQIARPGYTEPTNGTRRFIASGTRSGAAVRGQQTRLAPAGRPQQPEPKPAQAAV